MFYIVNGFPGSGKTTFEEMVKYKYLDYRCLIFSTINYVKGVARGLGWDGTKSEKNRKFLSDLKDLLTEWDDIPFKKIVKECKSARDVFEMAFFENNEWVGFIDCREPKEIQRLVAVLDAKTILVSRANVSDELHLNHADKNVLQYEYDIIINNNGSIDDLEKEVIKFLDDEKIKRPLY